jgi:hypothetical protein
MNHDELNIAGLIIAARTNAPGSWHDSRVALPIYDSLRKNTPPGYYLIAENLDNRLWVKGKVVELLVGLSDILW